MSSSFNLFGSSQLLLSAKFAARNLYKRLALRCGSSLCNTSSSKMDRMSNDVIYQVNWGTDSFSRSYGLRFVPGRSYSTEGTPRRKSMRSRVEHRIQNESSRGDKEIRRAKGVKLKLMPPDERLIYNLKRAICGEEVEGKRKSNNRTG